jgi:nucleoside-diphosphate-sugar epimerase
MMSDQSILVTGAAGFIGFHVARGLLAEGRIVVGLDNLNSCYDPALKHARLDILRGEPRFAFEQIDLADRASMQRLAAGPAAGAPAKVYNVGNNHPEELTHVVAVLEQELGRTAVREMLPMQPGDVTENFADVAELKRDTDFKPQTSIEDGLRDFVAWYRDYHRI